MDHDFWHERWKERNIGFHQSEINSELKTHFPKLSLNSKVLVPLCGKSKDMLWLKEQHFNVTGIELSQDAVEEFFKDNNLNFNKLDQVYTTEGITLHAGDLFKHQESDYDAIYDRASMVALPPKMRADYTKHLLSCLKENGQLLLIAFEYDQEKVPGPPFSVPEDEIKDHYDKSCDIVLLAQKSEKPKAPKFVEAGVEVFKRKTYLITKRPSSEA